MASVASRELRNATRSLLDRVAAGEEVTITVDGRPVAVLQPVATRRRWISKHELASTIVARQADAALTDDLRALAGELTDEHPLR